MADGNELDDDLTEDSVEYDPEEDGLMSLGLPEAGFSTTQQKIWANSVSLQLAEAIQENRILRTEVEAATRLASDVNTVVGEIMYADSDETIEEIEPLVAPSKPIIKTRLGTLEISWDGNDFTGGPMSQSLSGINVYAVKTEDLPENPDFSLRIPFGEGAPEDPELPEDGVTVLLDDPCDNPGAWMSGDDVVLSVVSTPPPHTGTGSIASTGFYNSMLAYREVDQAIVTPSHGEISISFWLNNLSGFVLDNLELEICGQSYPLQQLSSLMGWTEFVVSGLPFNTPLSRIALTHEEHPDGTPWPVLIDSVKVISVASDVPDPQPATVWPPVSIGTILPSSTGANVVFSGLSYNTEYTVWFLAVDPLGVTGDPSERTTAAVKPLVNTDLIGQVIDGANIVDGSITASDKVIANSITGRLIESEAINTGHLQANAITTDKLAAGAVEAEQLSANALDFNTAEGLQLYSGYIEAPTIASSPQLGGGGNFLNDPKFELAPDTAWVRSGFTGDTAVNQVDTVTWDQTWTWKTTSTGPVTTLRNRGNVVSNLRLSLGARKAGSLVAPNYSWLNRTARAIANPYKFKNIVSAGIQGQLGGKFDPTFNVINFPALATPTTQTTYLTNTAIAPAAIGDPMNIRLSTVRMQAKTTTWVKAYIELINAANNAVVWTYPVSATELQAGTVNAWWTSTFTGNLKFRLKAVYSAGAYSGNQMTRQPTASSSSTQTSSNTSGSSWKGTESASTPYMTFPNSNPVAMYLDGTPLGPEYEARAGTRLTVLSASFAKIYPSQGWKLTVENGLEMFDNTGARTARIDGQNNFMSGRFSTKEEGSRWEMSDNYLKYFTATEDVLGGMESGSGRIEMLGNMNFGGDRLNSNRTLRSLITTSGVYLNGSQSFTLAEPLADQMNGIMLEWSYYSDGASVDSHWHYTTIPKTFVNRTGYSTHVLGRATTTTPPVMAAKLVYIDNPTGTVIRGHAANAAAPTNAQLFVLRGVYGY